MVDRLTQDVVAVNATLSKASHQLERLTDIFTDGDAAEIRAGKFGDSRFMSLRKGDHIWAGFFESGDLVGTDMTYIDQDALGDDDTNHQFSIFFQILSKQHIATLNSTDCHTTAYFGALVRGCRTLIGFDSVMMYKFDSNLNGEVIAEQLRSAHVPSFLGQKFPSGDIPKSARDLFLMNKVRQIADVSGAPEPVVSTVPTDAPFVFDQSHSAFRYTSPVHLDYLVNMGVRATLTIGIVVRRKLWGLLSCHHVTGPMRVMPNKLTLCQVLSDLASNHIARLTDKQRTRAHEQAQTYSHVFRKRRRTRKLRMNCLI